MLGGRGGGVLGWCTKALVSFVRLRTESSHWIVACAQQRQWWNATIQQVVRRRPAAQAKGKKVTSNNPKFYYIISTLLFFSLEAWLPLFAVAQHHITASPDLHRLLCIPAIILLPPLSSQHVSHPPDPHTDCRAVTRRLIGWRWRSVWW